MKHLKITSVLLSVVMCVTMAFPSIGVIADEAAEPTETQTESTEKKQEPKATEKKRPTKVPEKMPEPKETEKKEEPKETAKEDPKETEKKEEPKETVKQEPKETEKKEEPKETAKEEPKETKETESVESSSNSQNEPGNIEDTKESKNNDETIISENAIPESKISRKALNNATFGNCGNGVTYTLNEYGTLVIKGSGEISSMSFSIDNRIKAVVIGKGVTGIGSSNFGGCDELSSVVFPNSLTTIGQRAFYSCPALTSVEIPNSVTTIGSNAFGLCYNLKNVTIDKKLHRSCDDSVFGNCSPKFTYYSYDITYTSDENGTISGTKNSANSTDVIVLNVNPKDNYIVDKVYLKDADNTQILEPDSNGKYSFEMPAKAVTVSAVFKSTIKPVLSKPTNLRWNGSIAVWDEVPNAEKYSVILYEGDDQIKSVLDLTSTSCDMTSWLKNGTYTYYFMVQAFSEGYSCSETVKSPNVTLTNNAQVTYYSVLVQAITDMRNGTIFTTAGELGVGGSVFVDKTWAVSGEKITITINTKTGYKISSVKVNGKPISVNYFTVMDEDVFVQVEFIRTAPNDNSLTVKGGKTAKIKYKKLKKKAQSVSRSKVMSVSNAQGKISYKLVSVSKKKFKKYFKINAGNGNVTVKKKLKKGTYTIKCSVTAAGNENYKPATKTVSFKIKVK